MLDLCKLLDVLDVKEEEEFRISLYGDSSIYRFHNGKLEYYDDVYDKWKGALITVNGILNSEIIKLPKKKQFTDDELCILRNIDKKYKYIARDKKYDNDNIEVGRLFVFTGYPTKSCDMWDVPYEGDYSEIPFNDIFKSIQWEDDEPVCIDDYVTRNKGDE